MLLNSTNVIHILSPFFWIADIWHSHKVRSAGHGGGGGGSTPGLVSKLSNMTYIGVFRKLSNIPFCERNNTNYVVWSCGANPALWSADNGFSPTWYKSYPNQWWINIHKLYQIDNMSTVRSFPSWKCWNHHLGSILPEDWNQNDMQYLHFNLIDESGLLFINMDIWFVLFFCLT